MYFFVNIGMNEFKILSMILALLYVIYDTEAIPYYLKLIDNGRFKTKEYFEKKMASPIPFNYLEFISGSKFNFLMNLLICPPCLSVWLVLILNFACNLGWNNLGYEVIAVWLGYPLLRKVIKKLYE